jgi:hypothetical protein
MAKAVSMPRANFAFGFMVVLPHFSRWKICTPSGMGACEEHHPRKSSKVQTHLFLRALHNR